MERNILVTCSLIRSEKRIGTACVTITFDQDVSTIGDIAEAAVCVQLGWNTQLDFIPEQWLDDNGNDAISEYEQGDSHIVTSAEELV